MTRACGLETSLAQVIYKKLIVFRVAIFLKGEMQAAGMRGPSGAAGGHPRLAAKLPGDAAGPTLQSSTTPTTATQRVGRIEELVPKAKLAKFFMMLAPQEKFEPEVLQALGEIGEDMVLRVIEESCQLASLKENRNLEPRDLLFILGT